MLRIVMDVNGKDILEVGIVRIGDGNVCTYEVRYNSCEDRLDNSSFDVGVSRVNHPFEAGFIQCAITALESIKQTLPFERQLPAKRKIK